MVLGLSISLFRKKQNKELKDVADYCGVPFHLIKDIEDNKVVVRKELLTKICECLEIPEEIKREWLSYLDNI